MPSRPATAQERAIGADEAVLRTLFERVPVVVVDVPFPTDPRPVADAILAAS